MPRSKNIVEINIKSEVEFILKNELIVISKEEMINLAVEHGARTAAIAAIVSRHLGEAPDDILKPNKELLVTAGANKLYMEVRALRTQVELETGKMIAIAQYSRPPATPTDYSDESDDVLPFDVKDALNNQGYAEACSDQYRENAIRYLSWSLGHVRNRLTELAGCGHDFRSEAETYAAEVMSIVHELENGKLENETN